MKRTTIKRILKYLEITNNVAPDFIISGVAPLNTATETDLSFCRFIGKKGLQMIRDSDAGLIFCHSSIEKWLDNDYIYIFTENPRLSFCKVYNDLLKGGKVTGVGDYNIHSSVEIGENVKIGDRTRIDANVVIYDNVTIGENCIIKAGAIIGGEGFGFEKDSDGLWIPFPQIGSVVIGDNVQIGSATCIDRGALGNTIIEDGVKIDNLCHIAHNVRIGKNTLVIALSEISGSVKIGEGSYIAPCVSTMDNIEIGKKCFIGIGSNVLQDIPDKMMVYGNPAKLKKFLDYDGQWQWMEEE